METRVKCGQAMLEYMLVFAALVGIVLALGCLVRGARASAERTATLVGAEYP